VRRHSFGGPVEQLQRRLGALLGTRVGSEPRAGQISERGVEETPVGRGRTPVGEYCSLLDRGG
ncbi:MAG TPA: hypothetical protein VM536_15940, partial [Chloroflexia bacterium]|nr:hypothetical protein [Chloroflexia bacterium]